MAFIPRTAEEILSDAINYLSLKTNLTDFNVGSNIRTILEAMAIEDADQYAQMLNILNSFFLENVSGTALDERAAQYDLSRLEAIPSTGTVEFLDTNLERTLLLKDVIIGDTKLEVLDASVFPSTPFTIRLSEGLASQEDIVVTAANTTTNILTLGENKTAVDTIGASFAHAKAATVVDEIDNRYSLVCYVSGNSDRIIKSGISLKSKGSNVNVAVNATTISPTTIANGNFVSLPATVVTTQFGSSSVVPKRRLTQISGGLPFAGATVLNTSIISGGQDREGDGALKFRIRQKIAGLSAGTVAALMDAALNLTDSSTAKSVLKLNVYEDHAASTVYLYISSGLGGFNAAKTLAITDVVVGALAADSPQILVSNATDFPVASKENPIYIILDTNNSNGILSTYQYKELNANTLTLAINLNSAVPDATLVAVPDVLTESSEADQKYYFLDRLPVEPDSLTLYQVTKSDNVNPIDGSNTKILKLGTDYILNEPLGQIEFLTHKTSPDGGDHVPPADSTLLAVFNSYAGLVSLVQREIDGDLISPLSFPGVRSAGVKVIVQPAASAPHPFVLNISVNETISSFETAAFLAQQALVAYITSLNIGADVIVSKIVDLVMEIPGVDDVKVIKPEDNIAIKHDTFADISEIVIS